jgi:MGT family glycosyltransferase
VERATPYWTRFPPMVDPSPFPTTVRTRETAPRASQPLPRWWGDDDRPLVYVTFGTVLGHMTGAGPAFAVALRAVTGLDLRVLLTVGRAFDPRRLGALPANVHVEQWVEQVDAMAAADAVVTHAGSGTTLGALAAGLPLVAVPRFADQFRNAERIAAAGAGIAVTTGPAPDGRRRPLTLDDAERIRAALDDVLADPAYGAAARRIGAAMAAAPTPDQVLATVTT